MTKQLSSSPILKNTASAPVVYFDGAPAYGAFAGVIEVELAARALMPKSDGNVAVDLICAAHLRCSLNAALNLREALDKAIAMATVPTPPKH